MIVEVESNENCEGSVLRAVQGSRPSPTGFKFGSMTEILPENGIGSRAGATMNRRLSAQPMPSLLKTPERD